MVKRVAGYAALCAPGSGWEHKFIAIGDGWCRPTDNFHPAGQLDDGDCAQACIDAGDKCSGFANSPAADCALYPQPPIMSAGAPYTFKCYKKL